MTETSTATMPPDTSQAPPPHASNVPEVSIDPTDVLMYAIVALLAPFFLSASCEDIYLAHLAAWKTVAQYRPRNHIHLIAIAQIIGSSLAGVGSIGLAVTEGLSLSMSLRLRANAAALFRAAEQARRVLSQGSRLMPEARPVEHQAEPVFIPDPNQQENEARLIAAVTATQQRAAETLARIDAGYTPPPAIPAKAAPAQAAKAAPATTAAKTASTNHATTTPAQTPQEMSNAVWRARWASAMTDVAQEFNDSLEDLPAAERALAAQRVEALNKVASTLLSGKAPPTLKPGDLDPNLST